MHINVAKQAPQVVSPARATATPTWFCHAHKGDGEAYLVSMLLGTPSPGMARLSHFSAGRFWPLGPVGPLISLLPFGTPGCSNALYRAALHVDMLCAPLVSFELA